MHGHCYVWLRKWTGATHRLLELFGNLLRGHEDPRLQIGLPINRLLDLAENTTLVESGIIAVPARLEDQVSTARTGHPAITASLIACTSVPDRYTE